MLTFDRKLARLFLEICRYTYAASFTSASNVRDKQDALDFINRAGSPDSIVMLDDGRRPCTSVACVVSYPDKNVVSYMGTKTQFETREDVLDSINDWSENLELLLVPFALTAEQLGQDHPDKSNLGGRVHRGFLGELSAVQAKVVQELMKRGGRTRSLYVTGHSQGGAEAALATRAFLAGGFTVASTYTFAAPRPGNAEFVQSVPATLPVHRIEFGDDVVPHVPPALVGRELKTIIEGLLKIPVLPDHVERVLKLMLRASGTTAFAGLGRLCYADGLTKSLRCGISADEEAAILNRRVMGLVSNPKHLADHHHLAGMTAEVAAGTKGNYTALVTDFTLVE